LQERQAVELEQVSHLASQLSQNTPEVLFFLKNPLPQAETHSFFYKYYPFTQAVQLFALFEQELQGLLHYIHEKLGESTKV
jgi:hypothetical protein